MVLRIILGVLIAAAAGYLYLTWQIALDPWSQADAFNSRTLPYVYGAGLLVSAGVLMFRKSRRVEPAQDLSTLGLLVLIALVFVVLLPFVGLWFALFGLLGAATLALGERRWRLIAGVSVAVPLVGWLIVDRLLGIVIPL